MTAATAVAAESVELGSTVDDPEKTQCQRGRDANVTMEHAPEKALPVSAAATRPTGVAESTLPSKAASWPSPVGCAAVPVKLPSAALVSLSSPLLVPAFAWSPDKPERSPLMLPKSSAPTSGSPGLLELPEVTGSLSLVMAGVLSSLAPSGPAPEAKELRGGESVVSQVLSY